MLIMNIIKNENSRIDIDLRNKSLYEIPETFLAVAVLANDNVHNYKKVT